MTIEQLREIQLLLTKRERIDGELKSLDKCLAIRLDVPSGCTPLVLKKENAHKEESETFDVMIVSGINNLQGERDKVSERLKELGLEE